MGRARAASGSRGAHPDLLRDGAGSAARRRGSGSGSCRGHSASGPACALAGAGGALPVPDCGLATPAMAPLLRASGSSRRRGDPRVKLLYRRRFLSVRLQLCRQTSGGRAAYLLDREEAAVGVLGPERLPGWAFPSRAQAPRRDICFP